MNDDTDTDGAEDDGVDTDELAFSAKLRMAWRLRDRLAGLTGTMTAAASELEGLERELTDFNNAVSDDPDAAVLSMFLLVRAQALGDGELGETAKDWEIAAELLRNEFKMKITERRLRGLWNLYVAEPGTGLERIARAYVDGFEKALVVAGSKEGPEV